MTDTTFNRAKEIKEKISQCEDEAIIIKKLYCRNKNKELTSEDIKALIELAAKGNNFMEGVYKNDFRNL